MTSSFNRYSFWGLNETDFLGKKEFSRERGDPTRAEIADSIDKNIVKKNNGVDSSAHRYLYQVGLYCIQSICPGFYVEREREQTEQAQLEALEQGGVTLSDFAKRLKEKCSDNEVFKHSWMGLGLFKDRYAVLKEDNFDGFLKDLEKRGRWFFVSKQSDEERFLELWPADSLKETFQALLSEKEMSPQVKVRKFKPSKNI